jgi:hypothetical protein
VESADQELPQIVRNTLEGAFKEHQRWLAQWQAQVAQLGQTIGADLEGGLAKLQEGWTKSESARLDVLNQAGRAVEEMFQKMVQTTTTWKQGSSGELGSAVQTMLQLHQALSANTTALNQVVQHQKQLAEQYRTGDLPVTLGALQQALTRLADTKAAPEGYLIPEPTNPTTPTGGFWDRLRGRKSR